MSTGLFSSRQGKGGPRRGYVPLNRRAINGHGLEGNKRLLAEALAQGAPSIAEATRQIGLPPSSGQSLFRAIRADLGWQAV
jgi:hypothetical protein